MTDQFEARLTTYIKDEIVLDDVEITSETDLLLSGVVDSLGVIRITEWVEDEAGILVDPGDVTIDNFQTIERIVGFISSRRASV